MATNIDYWEKVLENPTPPFKRMLEEQELYLQQFIKPGYKVIELGCGNGSNIQSILDITDDITGVDNDPKSIQDAKNNLRDHKTVKIIYICQLTH
ncbi:MAG: methyltransferase domain-containing protein [Patescibacteria group bacterium]|nr:methyltransferase domain-containing protein [Patescibacteria group bacterium]